MSRTFQLRRPVLKRTETVNRLPKRDLERGRIEAQAILAELGNVARPRTRGECIDGSNARRPCPWVTCKHHLALDLTGAGSIQWNFPDREVWQVPETCALDVADRGGATLEEVSLLLNYWKENVRRIESEALRKIRELSALAGLFDCEVAR